MLLFTSGFWLRQFSTWALCLLTVTAYGQQVVNGNIISVDDGEPLPGATILVKGTQRGTVSDISGDFAIEASPGEVLVVSFVGYSTQEITLDNRSNYDIGLSLELGALQEIVVMGYTSKSQKELSASVVSLDAKELQSVTAGNIETMLQGQAAGVTVTSSTGAPGAAADIRIRGITSINNDRPPLFVVDGIIGGNYVPSDVESITILKDAAAIGLYGAAGAAGVIIVTTRQGGGKPYLNASASFGIKEAVTGNFEMMNGAELYEAQRQMWGESNLVSFLNNRPEELEDRNFDWLDAAFDQAFIQNYNIASGGQMEGFTYSFNADYFNEEGTFTGTNFDRLNLRGRIGFSPLEGLEINTDINAQFSQSEFQHFSWFEDAFWNMPWDDPYAADGSLLGPDYVTNPQNEWYGQFRRSFLFSDQFDELGFNNTDLVWSTTLDYQITDWLSIETRTRLGFSNSRTDVYHSPITDFGLPFNGVIQVDQFSNRNVLSTHFLRFNKTYGDHEVGAFIAHEGGLYREETLNFSGQNLANNTVQVPAGASVVAIPGGGYGSLLETSGISYISELSYGYQGKYFATAYFRRDGSSVFAENKKFGNFYGGSAAWLLSEESFLVNNSAINNLKLRASYGTTGNSNIEPFLDLPTYDITRQYSGQPGGEPNNPANPNLGWESTSMFNVGFDLSFNMGLTANIDIYQKTVEGMLLNNPLAFSTGYQFRTENIGDMQNQGVELTLSYTKNFGNFAYRGNFNVSYNKNEITKVTDVSNRQPILAGSIQQINAVGEEAFQWYMPKWLGVDPDNGTPMWETVVEDENGNVVSRGVTDVYNEATFQPMGSSLPEITGGFKNEISYKGLSLSALFTFQTGNLIYHQTRFFVDSDGANTGINLMRLQDDWSRWEQPGDVATHPQLSRGGNNSAHQHSSRYIEKGDFLRLRNITISYVLPQNVLSWSGFKQASVNLRADNVATWTGFSGMDPDIGLNVEAFSLPGLSYLKYPISRQFVLGLNLNF